MKLLKTLVAAAAAFGVVATAQAGVTASGHVSFQVRSWDDNNPVTTADDDLDFQTNGFSNSRFRFKANKKVGANKWGIYQELGLPSGGSADNIDIRVNQFYVSGDWGKVSLGHGFDVGDGTLNADLAGTNLVTALTSNSATSGVGVNGFDPARGEALRYYTPKLGGVAKIGIQLQEGGDTEIALRADSNGFRFNAFIEDGDSVDKSGFLIGYKFSGFSITFVSSEDGNADIEHSGFKLGYATGKHKVSLSQVERDGGDEATGIQYKFDLSKGIELYAGNNATDQGDQDSTFFGARVKF